MKQKTTFLTALLTAFLAASAVQAGPFLFLEQLLGSTGQSQVQPVQPNQTPESSSADDVVIYREVRAQVGKESTNEKQIQRRGESR